MRSAALFAIELYQRYLSPYKGYCCAYRVVTGGASCSALGYRAIRRFGVWDGLTLLRERFALCALACRRWRARMKAPRQRGFIDGACDPTMCIPDPGACDPSSLPCDASSLPCDCSGSPCDVLDCFDERQKKRKKQDHLPRFATVREAARRAFARRHADQGSISAGTA